MHPGLVAGLIVREQVVIIQESIPWSWLLGLEFSWGEKTKSQIVGHPHEVPPKSGQPFQ